MADQPQAINATRADQIDLTGVWRFQPDAFDDGERLGYHLPECDTRRWREVAVPCSFDDCMPLLAAYEGMGWFRCEFELSEDWVDDYLALRFEGVNYNATVWVNGHLAGSHQGGFMRFDLPVAALARPGVNVLAVRADNTRRHGEVPGKERGWRPYGGILREVVLLRRPLLRIEQPSVVAQADGAFRARATVVNDMPREQRVTLSLRIADAQGYEAAAVQVDNVIQARGARDITIDGAAFGVAMWSPDEPALYEATFTLAVQAVPVDEARVAIGFRTIRRRGSQLILNGQAIRLRGFNRHEDSPRTGMSPDLEMVERDLRHMKQLGANFVRLCHYPHHPAELDLCDHMGLLVMGEIPLYWWNGDGDGNQPATVKLNAAKRQLSEMIARDINHPSIILWSVSNETHEQRPEVVTGNAVLVDLARKLDPTRLVTHVSDHWTSAPHFERDDVVCVNGYPTWSGRGWKSDSNYDVAESGRWWDTHLARLRGQYADRPILITEFGYPTLHGVFGNALGEDMQAAQLEAEARAFDKPWVCGMTVWCYADHPWPEEPFVNAMTTSPFGVVTRDRRRKKAVETVRAIFGAAVPEPGAAAAESLDNATVDMIRPHLRDIPDVPFPEGYGVRSLRRNEGGLWEDIWRDAEPFFKIENGLFEREFGDDPAAIERRCYIITAPDGVAVGTISSWYARDIKGLDYGRIHWVATRKAYQGKGIMRAGLSYALRQMAQWHERAILGTSTGRVAAIKLYLDYGFLPVIDSPHAREVWLAFRQRLNHPALVVLDEP